MATKKKESVELLPIIPVGAWVTLAAQKAVPVEVRGHLARVVTAPVTHCDGCVVSDTPHEHQDGSELFTVKTRDALSLTLTLTRAAFKGVSTNGRGELIGHA